MNWLTEPAPPGLSGTKRVHRIGKPEEIEEEEIMPRKRKEPEAAPTIEEASERARPRKKRKYTRRKAAKPTRAARRDLSEATFAVDDAGAISITCGDARIDLSPASTKRLALFIDRTKALRT